MQNYTKRYYENIKFACRDIDFARYSEFNILSLGCGASPDLMAFEEIAEDKFICYNGIDVNMQWSNLQEAIVEYASSMKNLNVTYEQRNVFSPINGKTTEIYNVVVLQFLISSILSAGGRSSQIHSLYKIIVEKPLKRWKSSSLQTPFLIILNDVDSRHRGRNTFFRLIDYLEESGYEGTASAKSAHDTGDLGKNRWSDRANQQGYGLISYEYSSCICNNSAFLVIEVTK